MRDTEVDPGRGKSIEYLGSCERAGALGLWDDTYTVVWWRFDSSGRWFLARLLDCKFITLWDCQSGTEVVYHGDTLLEASRALPEHILFIYNSEAPVVVEDKPKSCEFVTSESLFEHASTIVKVKKVKKPKAEKPPKAANLTEKVKKPRVRKPKTEKPALF